MEKLKTDRPITDDRLKVTREIAEFWNQTSLAWQTVWGPHIHHGYFETHRETPLEAQEKLIEKILTLLESPNQALAQVQILDVGCGLGGTSIYLAKKYRATVTGISLSQKQVDMATRLAQKEKLENLTFKVEDALSLASFPDHSFDIVWSLESCEQFYDKQMFIRQAFRVLKPGGRFMLATWCSGADEYVGRQAKQYRKLCVSFQLPFMPTINYYARLLHHQGFNLDKSLDWSKNVKESWTLGIANLRFRTLLQIFKLSGWRGLLFAKRIQLMQRAYDQHRVKYGVFLAHKR